MRIHAITTCVNFSDLLAQSVDRWLPDVTSFTVVTHPDDKASISLAEEHGCLCHVTESFYREGARFAKALALEEAMRSTMPAGDWVLMVDSDVKPPVSWYQDLVSMNLPAGNLYGARRLGPDGRPEPDYELAGFFMLFRHDDPLAQDRPLLDIGCENASGYDSIFQAKWPSHKKKILPIMMQHLEEPGIHWCGRGRTDLMEQLRRERQKRKGWRHERIPSL